MRAPIVGAIILASLAGCSGSNGATERAQGGTPETTAAASPSNGADVLLEDNDRAIAENKRLIAKLGQYQSADFPKYEHLRTTCETQVGGTLLDSGAPRVARCIEAGW